MVASYAPPSHCPAAFSAAVLEWSATCQGRQFDRIFGVWLGGVELLRSCTAEPTRDGIFWKVEKGITRYSSLLQTNQTLAVYLGNLVDKTYTGVYHVNITIHYYPVEKVGGHHQNDVHLGDLANGYRDWADLIIPISRNLPLNDGLWFEVENSADVQSKKVVIPKNVYRAVLEVYVSYHENDEFWNTNLPNDYLIANNLTKTLPGNGPFREVLVTLDGELVGAVWPFTVVFTGGINPLLWRPISAIGSFNLPSYDIEITPFLGRLLDGQAHNFGFSVKNSLNVWYIDANLHLWLDANVEETKAQLFEHKAKPLTLSSRSDFTGLDGVFFTGASRLIVSSGWVSSSNGNITTSLIQRFDFKNFMALRNNGDKQIVNQTIEFNTSVLADSPSSPSLPLYRSESYKNFPLFLYTNQDDQGNNSYTLFSNVTLGFNEDKILAIGEESSSSYLRNKQYAEGTMVVKGNLVVSGLGSTHQVYEYDEGNGKFCYFRNVSSHNYTILYDEVRDKCKSNDQNYVSGLGGPSSFRHLVYLLTGR